MERMACIKCKMKTSTKDDKNSIFTFDSCRNIYCGKCSELTTSEVRCIALEKRILKFIRSNCRINDYIDCVKKSVTDKNKKIEYKETVKFLENKRPTFADVTSNQIKLTETSKKNIPAIIIKSKNAQNTTKTKEDLDYNENVLKPIEIYNKGENVLQKKNRRDFWKSLGGN